LQGFLQNIIGLAGDAEAPLATCEAFKVVAAFGTKQTNCTFHISRRATSKGSRAVFDDTALG
jgi:hypothetical protein